MPALLRGRALPHETSEPHSKPTPTSQSRSDRVRHKLADRRQALSDTFQTRRDFLLARAMSQVRRTGGPSVRSESYSTTFPTGIM